MNNLLVFDMTGRIVLDSNNINSHGTNIDWSGFANEVYLLQIQTETGIITKKVIKQ